MLRYMPPIVAETIPEYVTAAGYAWAALMFVLGLGTIAAASTGDLKLWAFYVSVVLVGAKLAVLCRAICCISPARHKPDSCRPRRVYLTPLGLASEMRYTAARANPDPGTSPGSARRA